MRLPRILLIALTAASWSLAPSAEAQSLIVDTTFTVQPLCPGETTGQIGVSVFFNPANGGPYLPDQYPYNVQLIGPVIISLPITSGNTVVFNNVPAGSYFISASNSRAFPNNSVGGFGPVFIRDPDSIRSNAIATDITCNNANDGSIEVFPSGGVTSGSGYTVTLNPGGLVQTANPSTLFSNLGPGTYTVEVADDNDCPYDTTITIVNPPVLVVVGSPTDVTCNGDIDGRIAYTISGGTPGYTFSFDNAGGPFIYNTGSGNILGLAPGTYTLFARDTNDCEASAPVTIGEPDPLTANPTIVEPTCYGDADGVITLNPAGGNGGYSAEITPGATVIAAPPYTFGGLVEGTYDFEIVDALGCTLDTTINLTQPDTLTLNGEVDRTTCFGFSDGQINVTVGGGTPGYTYNFNGGGYVGAVPPFTGLAAGTYTLQVRDALGCTKDTTFLVEEPDPIFLNPTVTDVLCNGDATGEIALNPTGGTGTYSIIFNGGAPQVAGPYLYTGLAAGSYVINVIDLPNGCTLDTTIVINEPDSITVNGSTVDVLCNGDATGEVNAAPSGGTAPYLYNFNGGGYVGATPPFTGLTAGTYTLEVTDDVGCVQDTVFVIDEPDSLTFVTSIDTACFDLTNGRINLTVSGGTPGYEYNFNGAGYLGAMPPFTGLPTGSYTLEVRDAAGCTKDTTLFVPEFPELFAGGLGDTLTCFGDTDGVITAAPSGGSGTGYTFTIDLGAGPVAMTNPQGGLGAGSYPVVITDSRGCTVDTTYDIIEPLPLTLNESVTNIDCGGDSTGAISVAPSGGWGTIDVYFVGVLIGTVPPGVPDQINLFAGVYQYVLEDDSLCRDTFNVAVIENLALTLTPTPIPPTCHDISDGQIAVNITGGTQPYFAFIDGSGAQISASDTVFPNLNGDVVYQLVAQDINGCADTVDFFLDGPDTIRFNPIIDTACFDSEDGGIDLNPTGGNGGFTYLWTPDGETTQDITNKPGNASYTVTITDARGCDEDTTITIPEFPQIFPNPVVENSRCYLNDTATVTVTPSGGSGGPYTVELIVSTVYAGPNPATAAPSHTFDPLEADGLFQLVTTDVYGCRDTTDVATISPGPAVPDLDWCNVECTFDLTGSFTINSISGGLGGPLHYTVNNFGGSLGGAPGNTYGDPQPLLGFPITETNLGAATYTILITDSVNCVTPNFVNIQVERWDALITPDTVTCPWSSDGELIFDLINTIPLPGTLTSTCPGSGDVLQYYFAVDDSTGRANPTLSPNWTLISGLSATYPDLEPGFHELFLMRWDATEGVVCQEAYIDFSSYLTDPIFGDGPEYAAYVPFPDYAAATSAGPATDRTEWGYFQTVLATYPSLIDSAFLAPYFIIFAPDTVTAQTSSTPANRDDANGIIWIYNIQNGVNWPTPGYTFAVDDTILSSFVPFVLGNPLLNQVYDLPRGCYDFFVRDRNSCLYGPFPVCVDGELFIPNIFTPNGDGINDTWFVTGLPNNSELVVFNRWGNSVYRNSNYQNDWNGSGLSDGIYYYQLNMKDGREFKGWVEVVR